MNNRETLRKLREPGQAFCPYLFLHYHLDTDKKSKLCCHTQSSIADGPVDFGGSLYKNLRNKVLDNQKLSHCTKCYQAEADGYTSLRQRTIDDVHNRRDILFDQIEKHNLGLKIEPLWYDLRVSNNCNLSCIMCGPKYSSTWAKETGEDTVHLTHEPEVKIATNAFKIQLAGGEPFMIKSFARMLEKIDNVDCEIVVNTNATIVTAPLLTQLKRFKNVWIVVSLDGYGELNNQIRRGSDWNTIVKNIKLFIDCGFEVLVNTVLQRDNVNHLYELGMFIQNLGINDWIISPLYNPLDLHWQQQKNIIYENIEKTIELRSIQRNENSVSLLNHILKERP
jgi:sulfatase maturation enzyme AslB (radical SAM superfamily)